MGIIHSSLAGGLLHDDDFFLSGPDGVIIRVAFGAGVSVETLELITERLDKFITSRMGGRDSGAFLSHFGMKGNVERNHIIVLARSTGTTEKQRITQISLRRAKFMGLLALNIHAGQQHIYACNGMRNAFANRTEHLGGYRNNIHNGIGPAVKIAGADQLNVNAVNLGILRHKAFQRLLADGHNTIGGNLIAAAPFHLVHMVRLNDQTAQFNLFVHKSHLLTNDITESLLLS
ncbi:hypothetical protein SDC9_78550 [bioreactor metagenome]|uniref:Uncharacterized protein n=1 Tax=bioreactor metagenome TaxID=1076179 RepID=A0A644YZT2_9ZZZZ